MHQVKNISEGNKTVEVSFIGHFLGQSDKLVPLLNERFPELGLQQKDCFEMSWVESTVFWADYPVGTPITVLLNRPKAPAIFFKSKSDYMKKPISKEGIESIWRKMLEIENVWMQWDPHGSRMSEIFEPDTPFPHRAGNLFLIQYFTSWVEEAETNKYLELSRELYDEIMTPLLGMPKDQVREAFQNYRDLDIGANHDDQTDFDTAIVYGSKYFLGNFDRLSRVKRIVDPENFFKHEQSIPPKQGLVYSQYMN
jgi:hypothetical protein